MPSAPLLLYQLSALPSPNLLSPWASRSRLGSHHQLPAPRSACPPPRTTALRVQCVPRSLTAARATQLAAAQIAAVSVQPPARRWDRASDQSKGASAHLVARHDLPVRALDPLELADEVPELALGLDLEAESTTGEPSVHCVSAWQAARPKRANRVLPPTPHASVSAERGAARVHACGQRRSAGGGAGAAPGRASIRGGHGPRPRRRPSCGRSSACCPPSPRPPSRSS